MKKFLALIYARNLEFYRDRSALAWTLLFPFIVLGGFTYGYSGKVEPILKITVLPSNSLALAAIQSLKEIPGVELKTTDEKAWAEKKIERFEQDLFVQVTENGKHFTYSLNRESEKGKLGERIFTQLIALQPIPRPKIEAVEITGKKIRYADWLLPGLLAMNIMFGSMFGVGYVIVRYRKNGVLKRLRATPLSAFQFLAAQVASRMLLMVFTSLLVIGGSILLIGFKPFGGLGSWIDLTLFLAVSASAMISVGLVVAARISSEEVADGVLNLLTWPMIFLSGIWFSLDDASPWVKTISNLMPLTHVVTGLRAILIDGLTFSQVMPEVVILLVVSVVLVVLGSAIFRWR